MVRTTRRSSGKSPRSRQPRGGEPEGRLIRRQLIAVAALAALSLSSCGGESHRTGATSQAPPATANARVVGNSFAGEGFNEMPSAAQDLAVALDGVAITGASWVESGHDVRAYTTAGQPVGPRPGSTAGIFRDSGGGPLAVEATDTYLYAAQGLRLVRWDRSKFMNWGNDSAVYDGKTLTIRSSGGGELLGLTVCNADAYVVDPGGPVGDVSPNGTQIKVVSADLTGGVKRQWTVPRARELSCDREGDIWALQQRVGNTPARLARYSPSGSLLTAFNLPGEPMDVAAAPSADDVWVADNGPAQHIEEYNYSGHLVGTLGQSYLSGPDPGLVGSGRFAGPRSVDVDAKGDVYVAENGIPGRGTQGWDEIGKLLVLSKFDPSGKLIWRREGLIKASTGEPTADNSRLYVDATSYQLDGNGQWRYRAFTLDPFTQPNDPRYTSDLGFDDATNSQVRDTNGRRYVFMESSHAESLAIYRVDGELLTPVGEISNDDIDLAGRIRQRAPDRIPGNCVARDYFVEGNGDIWKLCQDSGGVWRYRLKRFRADGTPIYAWSAVDVYPMPTQISGGNAGRIDVEGHQVYVSGNAPGESSAPPDDWLWMGRRIVKFPSLPTRKGWPAPVWNKTVYYDASARSREKPVDFDVDGDRIAVGYQACQYPTFAGACLRIYSATTGEQLGGTIFATRSMGEVGWLDTYRPLAFENDHVYVEDVHLSKLWVVTP